MSPAARREPSSEPIIYVDRSDVRPGKLAELEAALDELAAFIEEYEPRLLAYRVYFDEDRTRMTVLHVHPDAASLDFHMREAGPRFPAFAEYLRLRSIDVFGDPGDDLLDRLREKAARLGDGTVRVHDLQAGFARLAGA